MLALEHRWQDNPNWWHWDEHFNQVLNDDAPEQAKESCAIYLQQLKEKGEYL